MKLSRRPNPGMRRRESRLPKHWKVFGTSLARLERCFFSFLIDRSEGPSRRFISCGRGPTFASAGHRTASHVPDRETSSKPVKALKELYIACAPGDHPVILGSGGFRKARWARQGKGEEWLSCGLLLSGRSGVDLHGCDLCQMAHGDALSPADASVLARLAAQIKKAANRGR